MGTAAMTNKTKTRLLYSLAALFIIVSMTYYVMSVLAFFASNLGPGNGRPQTPFLTSDDDGSSLTMVNPQAEAAGLRRGDTLVGLQGEEYRGRSQLLELTAGGDSALRPGDTLGVTVRRDGAVRTITFVLTAQKRMTTGQLLASIALLFLPVLVCLLAGYWVVWARPGDPNAWLLAGLLATTNVLFVAPTWFPGFWLAVLEAWYMALQALGPLALVLFGIYFPERWRVDRRLPFLKWLIIVPVMVALPTLVYMTAVQDFFMHAWTPRLSAMERWDDRLLNPLNLLCVLVYWAAILDKLRSSTTADARRRMRVVCAGSVVGLGALLIAFVLLPHFVTDPRKLLPVRIAGALLVLAFPLSLAYVVLVQRALDVRILIRMGTRYALARATLVVLEIGIALFIVIRFVLPMFARQQDLAVAVPVTILVVSAFASLMSSRNSVTNRMQAWLDRQFFREAYNAEVVLSELSEQARGFTETGPLIETISKRISEVLHVAEVGVFLRGGRHFQLQQAVGIQVETPLSFSESSSTIRNLMRSNQPATLYREAPDGWFMLADEDERETLETMRAELLLPLAGRDRLLGVMTLGPKRSEEAYSPTDLRLLHSVSTQTGLALEISELVRSLAQQATVRERMDRELEIAREVQERLFPQEVPKIKGLTLAGGCRAAQGVGGDYYDFILMEEASGDRLVENGRLGLAIGDISGKGISAALLMASLRASLRGVTMDGSQDLARVMQKVNRLVYEASATNRYATFFFAIFEPATRVMRFVNAGHNSPIIIRRSSDEKPEPVTLLLDGGGPVVGLLADAEYEEQQVQLQRGDLFIGYTDGISEAMTRRQEEWGEERMIMAATLVWSRTAPEILRHIFAAADAFTAGAPQHDDMTLLLMKLED